MNPIALVFAVATVAYTVTSTRIFRAPRSWIVRQSWDAERGENGYLGELVSCPYCFSHWVSFVLAGVYGLNLVHSGIGILDWFVSSLALVMGANIIIQAFRSLGRYANGKVNSIPEREKRDVPARS